MSTLYWVGNSGNWEDVEHWAAISGGPGGFGPPDKTDSAIFDSNSFNTPGSVVIVTGNMNRCGGMDWTGVTHYPTLSFVMGGTYNNAILLVSQGSIILNSYMDLQHPPMIFENLVDVALNGPEGSAAGIQTEGNVVLVDGNHYMPTILHSPEALWVGGELVFGTLQLSSDLNGEGLLIADPAVLTNINVKLFMTLSEGIIVDLSNIKLTCQLLADYGGISNYPDTLRLQMKVLDEVGLQILDTVTIKHLILDTPIAMIGAAGTNIITINIDTLYSNGFDYSRFEGLDDVLGVTDLTFIRGHNILLKSIYGNTVSISNTVLEYIPATGADFLAYIYNGNVDGGGNEGWTFYPVGLPTEQYYNEGNTLSLAPGVSFETWIGSALWDMTRKQIDNQPITPTHHPGCGYWWRVFGAVDSSKITDSAPSENVNTDWIIENKDSEPWDL